MNKRILIIDDDNFIINILKEKLKNYKNLEILTGTSYKEGIMHINRNVINAAIIDLSLPDCKDGDMANYSLSKEIPTIVLTGKYNEDIEKKLLQYNTLDFFLKDGKKGILNSIFAVKRILNNYETNVLIVDDSKLQLNMLKDILNDMKLNVDIANDGETALNILTTSKKKYSLVITHYNMPNMDGIELVYKLREFYNKDELGILAISSNSSSRTISKFIKAGANDYLHKPYNDMEIRIRINSILDLLDLFKENNEIAFKDYLTNLYNRRYFFKSGQMIFNHANRDKKDISIAMIDIDDFKKINDLYGHDIGDICIKKSAELLTENIRKTDLLARFGGEEFCIILENISIETVEKFFEKIRKIFSSTTIDYENIKINFTISIGVAYGSSIKLEKMIKDADKALYQSKNNGKNLVTTIISK